MARVVNSQGLYMYPFSAGSTSEFLKTVVSNQQKVSKI